MYEGVRVAADGRTTVSRFARTVARAGYDGLVVRNRQSDPATYDPATLAERYDIDVVVGFEIDTADKAVASGAIGNRRSEVDVLVLRGQTPELNRYGAETPQVDVLADPMGGDGDVNHVIVEAAADNEVALEVNLGHVLRETGGARVEALRGLRKLRELIEASDAPYVVSADPETHLQVRSPRELIALGAEIGFDPEAIRLGLERWGTIAAKNRRRQDPDFVAPGVRVEPDPGDTETEMDDSEDSPAGPE